MHGIEKPITNRPESETGKLLIEFKTIGKTKSSDIYKVEY